MQELNDIDFEKYLQDHENRKIAQNIEYFDENFDDVYDYMINGSQLNGQPPCWSKMSNLWRIRESEVTLVAGVNGNGKTTWLSQMVAFLDTPTVIASLEMPTKTTKAKMLRQVCGMHNPSPDYAKNMMAELKDQIYLFNQIGTVTPDVIRGLIVYAAEVLKVKQIVIDSLVKVKLKLDDHSAQRDFVSQLSELAKEYKVHIFLVVHMRKGADETAIPDKYSVKHAGELVDLCDNLLIVARNMKKVIALQNPANVAEYEPKPDGFLRIAKNRHGDFEGLISFWFDTSSQQWLETRKQKPLLLKNWSRNDKNTTAE